MEFAEMIGALEAASLWAVFAGIAILATSSLPRMAEDRPFSMPMAMLVLGYLAVALPLGLEGPNPLDHGEWTEHLTEFTVIISLMGVGLSIDRPPSFSGWSSTARLLGITMVLTIAACALLGWWLAAFVPATAILLGAVIAPTDPVLAAGVQVGPPTVAEHEEGTPTEEIEEQAEEDEVRFALTSEAGLNDGLAFPFTHLAIAIALATSLAPRDWLVEWVLVDVLYKLVVGGGMGYFLGKVLARTILWMPAEGSLAKAMMGLGALGATLVIYGGTEYVGGYGFLAVFIGAVTIRNYERDHEHHAQMHIVTEKLERIFIALILLGLGGAIAGGLLDPLTWQLVVCAFLIVFVIRPVTGVLGMIGLSGALWRERLAIAFFGVRGVGSLYYLAFAINEAHFQQAPELWALVSLVIVISVLVHGITASPVTSYLERVREAKGHGHAGPRGEAFGPGGHGHAEPAE